MKFFLIAFISLLMYGCTTDTSVELEEMVDYQLVKYFERFEEEAALRGYNLSWNEENIYASIVSISEDAAGQCLSYDNGLKQINIDESYWMKSNDIEREFLIFHELGHCILRRSHFDLRKNDGTCISIMNSGESLCRKNYTVQTRKEYIDELFS